MRICIKILFACVAVLFGWVGYICYCNLAFDPNNSVGIIISVLSVLVTALVGWQIYTLIDLRNTKATFEQIKENLKREINMHAATSFANFADVYCFQNEYYYRTFCLLQHIVFLSKNKEYEKCGKAVDTILLFSKENEIEQFKYDMLVDLLDQVENPSQIKDWKKLRKFIENHFKLKADSEDEKITKEIANEVVKEKRKKKKHTKQRLNLNQNHLSY